MQDIAPTYVQHVQGGTKLRQLPNFCSDAWKTSSGCTQFDQLSSVSTSKLSHNTAALGGIADHDQISGYSWMTGSHQSDDVDAPLA